MTRQKLTALLNYYGVLIVCALGVLSEVLGGMSAVRDGSYGWLAFYIVLGLVFVALFFWTLAHPGD